MKELIQADKAIIYKFEESHFEVWIKLHWTVGKNKGQLIEPKDEDFGVTAWNAYTLETARKYFEEIETGKRTISPMVEES